VRTLDEITLAEDADRHRRGRHASAGGSWWTDWHAGRSDSGLGHGTHAEGALPVGVEIMSLAALDLLQ